MNPRLVRYLKGSIVPVGIVLLLVLVCNLIAQHWKIDWLYSSLGTAIAIILTMLVINWTARADPQDSD